MDNNKIIIALVVIFIVLLVAGIIILNPGHAKVDSRVIIISNSTLHDGDSFTIKLTDLNNTPIANQVVNITIVDPNGAENHQVVTTDVNGEGCLQLNGLATTNYTVNISFGGNDNFTSCNATQKLQMKEKVVEQASNSSNNGDNSQSSNTDSSSQSSNQINYDAKLNLYYDNDGVIVDPDGNHWMEVGNSYYEVSQRGPPI